MIPIYNFCWQDFSPIQIEKVTVAKLYDLAQGYITAASTQTSSPELFILNDPAYRVSALVLPDLVVQVIEELQNDFGNYFYDEPAVAVGLWDLLRNDQLLVSQSQPAILVARLALWAEAKAVIAVDDDAKPVGLFIPSVVAEQLPYASMIQQSPIRSLIKNTLFGPDDLPSAIKTIEKEFNEFHSERLNMRAPDPYVCPNHGKPHKTSFRPCKKHPDVNTEHRLVARR